MCLTKRPPVVAAVLSLCTQGTHRHSHVASSHEQLTSALPPAGLKSPPVRGMAWVPGLCWRHACCPIHQNPWGVTPSASLRLSGARSCLRSNLRLRAGASYAKLNRILAAAAPLHGLALIIIPRLAQQPGRVRTSVCLCSTAKSTVAAPSGPRVVPVDREPVQGFHAPLRGPRAARPCRRGCPPPCGPVRTAPRAGAGEACMPVWVAWWPACPAEHLRLVTLRS